MIDARYVQFPELDELEPGAREIFERAANAASVPAGSRIFSPGQQSENWFMVMSGSVRVQQVSDTGKELVICRVEGGGTCIVSALSILSNQPYTTEAIAETDVEALVLPAEAFTELLNVSARFRQFVFNAYTDEIISLMALVDRLAFRRIDGRLVSCLLQKAGRQNEIRLTHQDLATELGTAREVVSRQLKRFEQQGWLRMGRGKVTLVDPRALREVATMETA